jgi:site-specific DNA-methyltransferase (cytosine-N4-specific)
MVAEQEGRRWLAFEESIEYVATSSLRFGPPSATSADLRDVYRDILDGKEVTLDQSPLQRSFLG